MLRDLKISMPQKVGLAFTFSLAFVCVALDIVRVIEAVAQNQALYTIIEINFVVIISCLPTYRAVLGIGQRNKSSRSSQLYGWRSLERRNNWKDENGDNHPLRLREAVDIEMDGKCVHVTKNLDILNEARDPYPLDPLELPI